MKFILIGMFLILGCQSKEKELPLCSEGDSVIQGQMTHWKYYCNTPHKKPI